MGCDWSVLSHSNLSAPAAALSLSVCLSLCLSLACLRCKLPAAAAAALCARCRSRVHIDTHTLLSVCAYTTTHTHTTTTPITAAATQARPSHCHRCASLLLLPGLPSNLLSLPGAADLRVSRSSSTAEKERPPATYHHQRQPTRELQCSPTHNSNLADTTPPPLTTRIEAPPCSQQACCRATLAAPSVRLHPRCWTVSTSPALDRLSPFSLARASTIDFFDLQCTEKPAR
jgi:hypothetical protein